MKKLIYISLILLLSSCGSVLDNSNTEETSDTSSIQVYIPGHTWYIVEGKVTLLGGGAIRFKGKRWGSKEVKDVTTSGNWVVENKY